MKVNSENKIGLRKIAGGLIIGKAVDGAVKCPGSILCNKVADSVKNICKNISDPELEQIQQGIEETMHKTGLKEKGVSILKVGSSPSYELKDIAYKIYSKGKFKFYPERSVRMQRNGFMHHYCSGQNMAYIPMTKTIIAPEKKLDLCLFHEIGHAANDNFGIASKALAKATALSKAVPFIAAIALLKPASKKEEKKSQNPINRVTSFIKKNAGKLTFAAFLPYLAEEGLASIKGNKYSKECLTPALSQVVKKSNRISYISHLSVAVFTSLGIFTGTKIKDLFVKPKNKEA